jgi:iron complex outermembrane receptor protein
MVSAQHTVADLISQSAGVNLNGQGGLFQSYNIRGFSRARIKTEIDGIPIITDRRAGNSVAFIPAELISEVYIQKGPQSTLYGSDAMGGVVSISTQSHETSAVSFALQPQDNAKHLSANFVSDTISASIVNRTANNANSAKNKQGKTKLLNSQYQQRAATLSSEFNWHNIDIFASAIISRGDDIGKSSTTFPDQRISNYPQDDHLLSQIEFSSAGQWKFKLYQHQQQWQTDITRLDDEQKISRRNITNYQSDTYGAYGSWLINNTVLGVEWLGRDNIKIGEQEFSATNELAWQNEMINADEDTFAVFTLHDWTFNDFTLATGVRYDQIKLKQYQQTKEDSFLSLSINTRYQLSKNTSISLQVANAFRFPTVSELFFSGETPRGNTQGNSELTPEKSIGLQFSIAHRFNQGFSTTFNGYHYKIDDYIERYKQDNIRRYRNNQQVTIKGLELTHHWQINQQWQSTFGFQWQQGQDQDNNVVDDGIPKAFKWSLNWQNDSISIRQQLSYQFSQQHVGASEIARESELIWHTEFDYQVNDHLQLSISVINLTDNLYKSSSDEDAAYQPERTISFSGVWQF